MTPLPKRHRKVDWKPEEVHELRDLEVAVISLVDQPAIGREFVAKAIEDAQQPGATRFQMEYAKRLQEIEKRVRRDLASRGGRARAAALSPEQRRKIAAKGGRAKAAAKSGVRAGLAGMTSTIVEAGVVKRGPVDLRKSGPRAGLLLESEPGRVAKAAGLAALERTAVVDHDSHDESPFLLQLVFNGLLSEDLHAELMKGWKREHRDYAHLGPQLDTVSTWMVGLVSDGDLVAMGLSRIQVAELRRVCAEVDLTAVPGIDADSVETTRKSEEQDRSRERKIPTVGLRRGRPEGEATIDRVFRSLPTAGEPVTLLALLEVTGIARSTVQAALTRLMKDGRVERVGSPGRAHRYRRAIGVEYALQG